MPKITATAITIAITVIGNKEVALDFGMLTRIGVPFKVHAGIEARHSVSATNVVATEAQTVSIPALNAAGEDGHTLKNGRIPIRHKTPPRWRAVP